MLPGAADVDYMSSSIYIKNHLLTSDGLISLMPHVLDYYIGRKNNYYLQGYTSRQIFYDVSETSGKYLDKYVVSPVIRNIHELMDVIGNYRRVWIMAAPYQVFTASNEPDVVNYVFANSKLMYETYKAKVFLLEQ